MSKTEQQSYTQTSVGFFVCFFKIYSRSSCQIFKAALSLQSPRCPSHPQDGTAFWLTFSPHLGGNRCEVLGV